MIGPRVAARVLLGAVALVLLSCSEATSPGTLRRAPIILVSLDTVRKDAVSGFGAPPGRTPALERLGSEGFRFQNAIASSHHTAPSHATILTGFTPFVHGVALADGVRVFRIPEAIPLLAEVLQEAGYRTGGFTDGVQLLPERGFDRGFDVYEYEMSHLEGKLRSIERFVDSCGDRPFFLFAHTYRAHAPYRAEAARLEELLADHDTTFAQAARAVAALPLAAVRAQDKAALRRQGKLTMALSTRRARDAEDVAFLRALYGAGVEATDAEFGLLFDLLRRKDLLDRAIVVVTSDHGEAFAEHDLGSGHMDLWDEVLRVPLIIRLPGGQGAGTEVEGQVGSERLVPTLLDLIGVGSPLPTEGWTFARTLLHGETLREQPVFSAMYVSGRCEPIVRATRSRFFKRFDALVPLDDLPPRARLLHPVAFFDLVADPAETRNLAPTGHPQLDTFARIIAAHSEQCAVLRHDLGIDAGLAEVGPSELEAMRGIGYLDGE